MLNFQVACAQKFKTKNDCFCTAGKYGMLLLIVVKILEKIIRMKY